MAGNLDETVLRHGQDLTRHAESLQASWQTSGQILAGYGGVALVELCLTLFLVACGCIEKPAAKRNAENLGLAMSWLW